MIDEVLAAFLQEGIAIHLGTRNAALEPNGARAIAARVDGDGQHIEVFVPDVAVGPVLADLGDNGQAAVCFARPQDDRACQVKGVFASARPATQAEEPMVAGQWRGFLDQLAIIGIPGESTRPWIVWPCTAVRIRVTAVYSQTPGPDAGKRLS